MRHDVTFVLAVSLLRWKLWRKAKQEPKFRFYALYDRIYRLDVLTVAWWLVSKNDGAPGVDGMSCRDIVDGPGAGKFLEDLQEELRSKTLSTTSRQAGDDPQGQRAASGRWAFRPSRTGSSRWRRCSSWSRSSRRTSMSALTGSVPENRPTRRWTRSAPHLQAGLREVYDADLKGYFDTIPHDQLMKCLQMRITDRSVLHLIRSWLEAPIVERDEQGRHDGLTARSEGRRKGE